MLIECSTSIQNPANFVFIVIFCSVHLTFAVIKRAEENVYIYAQAKTKVLLVFSIFLLEHFAVDTGALITIYAPVT